MHDMVRASDHAYAEGLSQAIERLLPSWDVLVERLPIGIYVCDRDGRVVRYNQRAADIWGRAPVPGDPKVIFCGASRAFDLNGRELPRSQAPMGEVLREGVPVHDREVQIEHPDGTRIVIRADIDPLFDDEGSIIGGVNCFQDVTEQKRAEANLRRSEQRARDLLEALPAAVYTTDAAGKVTFCNQAAVDLAGRTPDLGVDQWCVTWRLYWPDGRPMPHDTCPMAVTLKENRPVRGAEAIAERPDGTRVPIVPYPTPLRDESGGLVGAVNMLVDISARKDAEGRQKVLLEELNHRVKNNMQMLYALLRTAQREIDNQEAKAVLMDVSRRVAATAAAQQVLYDSDVPTKFDAGDFLRSICAGSGPLLAGDAEIEIEAASGELSNDMAMPLALIVNELLTNAFKHGVNGRGRGRVKLGLSEGPDSFTLYVEDDGPGFDPAAVRKRSSGLGLVLGLSHQLGGNFEVTRTPGARCTVRFPRA